MLQLHFAWASEAATLQGMHYCEGTEAALLHCPDCARLCTASCWWVLPKPLVLSASGGRRSATCSGGALFSTSSGGVISDTLFQQNSASLGGAIWENAGRLTITGSKLTANGAVSGGAIYEVQVAQVDCLASGSP